MKIFGAVVVGMIAGVAVEIVAQWMVETVSVVAFGYPELTVVSTKNWNKKAMKLRGEMIAKIS